MPEKPSIDTKLYCQTDGKTVSMLDLLAYFAKHGTLRVSDLHLKVGCPPAYRVDGELQKLGGPPLDDRTVAALASTLLDEGELESLRRHRAVDSSYITDTMQFRLNCFCESDGLAVAIRALEPRPIAVEEIGFPNNIWQDILARQWGLVLVTGITGAGKSTTIAR